MIDAVGLVRARQDDQPVERADLQILAGPVHDASLPAPLIGPRSLPIALLRDWVFYFFFHQAEPFLPPTKRAPYCGAIGCEVNARAGAGAVPAGPHHSKKTFFQPAAPAPNRPGRENTACWVGRGGFR